MTAVVAATEVSLFKLMSSWKFLSHERGYGICDGNIQVIHVLLVLLGYGGDGVVVADHQTVLFSVKLEFPNKINFKVWAAYHLLSASTCSSSKTKPTSHSSYLSKVLMISSYLDVVHIQ